MKAAPVHAFLYVLLFAGAVLAGWCVRSLYSVSDSRPSPVPCHSEPAPGSDVFDHEDPVQSAMMVADALVDADSSSIARVAADFIGSGNVSERAWHQLFSCWMKLNPREAWDFANRHPATTDFIGLPVIALEQWSAVDPLAARKVVGRPDARQYSALIRGRMNDDAGGDDGLIDEALAAGINLDDVLFQSNPNRWSTPEHYIRLARIHPFYAVALAERQPDSGLLGAVFVGWYGRSPVEARKWLDQRKDGVEILTDSVCVMSGAGCYLPETMDLFMTKVSPGNARSEMVQDVMESLAIRDVSLALKEAARLLSDPADRAEALGKIAHVVAGTDYSKAWDILAPVDRADLGIRRVDMPGIEILDHGKVRRVQGPMDYRFGLVSMRGLTPPAEVKSQLLAGWMEVDKGRTLELMEKLSAEELALVAGDCMRRWISRDPKEAIEWLARKLGNQGNPDDVEEWMDQLNLRGDKLRSLVGTLPEGTVRMVLSIIVADGLADEDPAAALQFARQCASADAVVGRVYLSWAFSDPKAALKCLVMTGESSPTAWETVVAHACGPFPDETIDVIGSLPHGPVRDSAVLTMTGQCAWVSDPMRVAEWALSIDGEDCRREAMELVFTRIGLDLRLAGSGKISRTMRGLIRRCEHVPETERSYWLERVNREFTQP